MSAESAFQKIEEEKREGIYRFEGDKMADINRENAVRFDAEKQKIMRVFKEKIKELEKTGKVGWEDMKNRIVLKYDRKGEYGKKFVCEYKGKEYKLSLGDIMADYNWGIKYMPDSEMPEDVCRKISKRILTNEARRDIEDIYDEEMGIKSKMEGEYGKHGIYSIVKRHKTFKSQLEHGEKIPAWDIGLLSEQMVREFMTRAAYTLSEIPDSGIGIKIKRANIEEDVKKKIDFKVITFSHVRGVKTVDEENINKIIGQFQRLGFQLATAGSGTSDWHFSERLEYKKQQIEKVKNKGILNLLDIDDIVLVGIRTEHTIDLYNEWFRENKPSGGPEKLWNIEQKKRVFRAITEKLKLDIPDGMLEKILK